MAYGLTKKGVEKLILEKTGIFKDEDGSINILNREEEGVGLFYRSYNPTMPPGLQTIIYRGTQEEPLIVESEDILWNIYGAAWNGSEELDLALIRLSVSEVFENKLSGQIIFFTKDTLNENLIERLRIDGDGIINLIGDGANTEGGICVRIPLAEIEGNTWILFDAGENNYLNILVHPESSIEFQAEFDLILNPTGKLRINSDIFPEADNGYYLGKNSITTPKAFKGVILKDTTNANYYRLEVTNGAVIATQIT